MAVFYKYEYTNKTKNIHPWSLLNFVDRHTTFLLQCLCLSKKLTILTLLYQYLNLSQGTPHLYLCNVYQW